MGKYPIKLNVSSSENVETSLLSIGFYLDFFSKNSEISYIKNVIENELKVRVIDLDQIYFSISSNEIIISEIFKGISTTYERVLTILSVLSFYLPELNLSELNEVLKCNKINIVSANINSKK